MTDIFISYARDDREAAKSLARALENQGWSVWWDPNIPTGKDWRKTVEAALASARCVVVMWSRHSVESENVQDEADEAKKRGILIPINIEPVEPPFGFRRVQYVELFGWDGGERAPGFEKLTADIRALLSATVGERARNRSLEDLPTTASHSAEQASPAEPKNVLAQLEAIRMAARAELSKPAQDPVTDQDWERVTDLDLAFSGIDDMGLRYLSNGNALERLDLSGNCVTDAGLKHLSRLGKLEYLDLSGNAEISDAGLVHFRGNERLCHLNLASTAVTAYGLRQLTGLASLCELVLRNTRITVDGFDSLAQFSLLVKLDLGNTAVNDDVVPHLERMVHLEYLGLRQTQISESGRERLRRALPRCRLTA